MALGPAEVGTSRFVPPSDRPLGPRATKARLLALLTGGIAYLAVVQGQLGVLVPALAMTAACVAAVRYFRKAEPPAPSAAAPSVAHSEVAALHALVVGVWILTGWTLFSGDTAGLFEAIGVAWLVAIVVYHLPPPNRVRPGVAGVALWLGAAATFATWFLASFLSFDSDVHRPPLLEIAGATLSLGAIFYGLGLIVDFLVDDARRFWRR